MSEFDCERCGGKPTGPHEACPDCGYRRVGHLILAGAKAEARLRISTDIGRELLKVWTGEDGAKFAASLQYRLHRDPAEGWLVRGAPGTPHPTCVNGTPLGDRPRRLEDGDRITIGASHASLTVSFDWGD